MAEGADDRSAVGGEWFVSDLTPAGATFTREHRKGDVAIRGYAADLVLWLWKRYHGSVEILGDAGIGRALPLRDLRWPALAAGV